MTKLTLGHRHIRTGALALALALISGPALVPLPVSAQEEGEEMAEPAPGGVAEPGKGPVTNLPLPRYVSLKTSDGNVRRGPSLEHRIDWVFRHRDMPLRVTAEFEHWRRVEDNEGQGGWIYYTLLSGVRTVLVTEPDTALHAGPGEKTAVLAKASEGVIGRLGPCTLDWCEISAGGETGWVAKARLWGVEADEVRE